MSKYETKDVLYKELRAAIASHAKKSEVRKIKMKLKMNNLPTIIEEDTEALVMD